MERWLLSIPFNLHQARSQNNPAAWKNMACMVFTMHGVPRAGAGGAFDVWVWFWNPATSWFKTIKPHYLLYSFQMVALANTVYENTR
jgi:hypothetical protein